MRINKVIEWEKSSNEKERKNQNIFLEPSRPNPKNVLGSSARTWTRAFAKF
jgi:hypothetical protein